MSARFVLTEKQDNPLFTFTSHLHLVPTTQKKEHRP